MIKLKTNKFNHAKNFNSQRSHLFSKPFFQVKISNFTCFSSLRPHLSPVRFSPLKTSRCLGFSLRPFSTDKKPITYHPKEIFAVVHVGGSQFKVTPGDVIVSQKLQAPVSSEIVLQKVLLCGGKDFTLIGTPLLDNVKVHATVEEQTLAKKQIIFKMKRRNSYRLHKGHRQPITTLRIQDIVIDSLKKE